MPTQRVDVAAEVRAALARKRISQRQLANLLGLTQPVVWRRLRGDVAFSVDELQAVAEALEVPVSSLIGGEQAAAVQVAAPQTSGDAA